MSNIQDEITGFIEEVTDRLNVVEKKCVELRGPSQREFLLSEVAREIQDLDTQADMFGLTPFVNATHLVQTTLYAIQSGDVRFTMQFMVLLFRYVSSSRQYLSMLLSHGPDVTMETAELEAMARTILGDHQSLLDEPPPQFNETAHPEEEEEEGTVESAISAENAPSPPPPAPPPPETALYNAPQPDSAPEAIGDDRESNQAEPSEANAPSSLEDELNALLDSAPKVAPNLKTSSGHIPPLRPITEQRSEFRSNATRSNLPPPPNLPSVPPLPEDERVRRATVTGLTPQSEPDGRNAPAPTAKDTSDTAKTRKHSPINSIPETVDPHAPADENDRALREIEQMLDKADIKVNTKKTPPPPVSAPASEAVQKMSRQSERLTPLPGTFPPIKPPESLREHDPMLSSPLDEPESGQIKIAGNAASDDREDTHPATGAPDSVVEPKIVRGHKLTDPRKTVPVINQSAPTPDADGIPGSSVNTGDSSEDAMAFGATISEATRISKHISDYIHSNPELADQLARHLHDMLATLNDHIQTTHQADFRSAFNTFMEWFEPRAAKKGLDIALQLDIDEISLDESLGHILVGIARRMVEISLFSGIPPRGALALKLSVSAREPDGIVITLHGLPTRTGLPLGLRLGPLKRRLTPIGGKVELDKAKALKVSIPLDCGTQRVQVVRVGSEELLAIPDHYIAGVTEVAMSETRVDETGLPVAPHDNDLPLLPMTSALSDDTSADVKFPVVTVVAGELRLGLWVDEILENGDFLFRPVSEQPGSLGTIYNFDLNHQAPVLDVPPILWQVLKG